MRPPRWIIRFKALAIVALAPAEDCFICLKPGRIFGEHAGPPPVHEPWINRPFSVGVFVGPVIGSPLIDDWVGQQTGTLGGLRLGWDMDDDWGIELRLATANIPIYDSPDAVNAAITNRAGLSTAISARRRRHSKRRPLYV